MRFFETPVEEAMIMIVQYYGAVNILCVGKCDLIFEIIRDLE